MPEIGQRMTESSGYEKAFLDLSVKITEMAGDIKLVLLQVNNSDKKHEEHTRRLDQNAAEISQIKTALASANAQALTPKKVWTALGVLAGIATVLVATVAVIVSLATP
jgi:chromosome segregation ATPase